MALCQISLVDYGLQTAKLSADVRATDVQLCGCAVRVVLGITGGSFVVACGTDSDAARLMWLLREVLA